MERCKCFCAPECTNGNCPNAQYESVDSTYGSGIADDCGMKKVSCAKCAYNTGLCKDCLFENSIECPRTLKLYHATSVKNLEAIRNEGLKRGCPSNFKGMNMDNCLYLALNPDAAIWYAKHADSYRDKEVVVFSVTLSSLDSDQIRYDWNNRCEYEKDINSIAYSEDIPIVHLMSDDEIRTADKNQLDAFKGTSLYEIVTDVFYEQVETNKEEL